MGFLPDFYWAMAPARGDFADPCRGREQRGLPLPFMRSRVLKTPIIDTNLVWPRSGTIGRLQRAAVVYGFVAVGSVCSARNRSPADAEYTVSVPSRSLSPAPAAATGIQGAADVAGVGVGPAPPAPGQ